MSLTAAVAPLWASSPVLHKSYRIARYYMDQNVKYLTLNLQPRQMEAISHYTQNVTQYFQVVFWVKCLYY